MFFLPMPTDDKDIPVHIKKVLLTVLFYLFCLSMISLYLFPFRYILLTYWTVAFLCATLPANAQRISGSWDSVGHSPVTRRHSFGNKGR